MVNNGQRSKGVKGKHKIAMLEEEFVPLRRGFPLNIGKSQEKQRKQHNARMASAEEIKTKNKIRN